MNLIKINLDNVKKVRICALPRLIATIVKIYLDNEKKIKISSISRIDLGSCQDLSFHTAKMNLGNVTKKS